MRFTRAPTELAEAGLHSFSVQAHKGSGEERASHEPAWYSAPGASSLSDVSKFPKDLSQVECPDGVMTLQGSYELNGTRTFNCSKVIAHDAFLELSETWSFNSELVELEGNLSLRASAEGFHCLMVKGVLVMNSGHFFISGCRPKLEDEARGSAIQSKAFIQQGGNVSIRSCRAIGRARGLGGAIWTMTFNQTGGSLAIKSCQAESKTQSSLGGAIFALKSFLQSGGSLYIEDCMAFSTHGTSGGGAVYAEHFRASGGHTSIQDCSADAFRSISRGGGIASREVRIEGEALLTVRRCKASWAGSPQQGKKRARGGLVKRSWGSERIRFRAPWVHAAVALAILALLPETLPRGA